MSQKVKIGGRRGVRQRFEGYWWRDLMCEEADVRT